MRFRTAAAVFLVLVVTAPACSRGGGTTRDVPFVAVNPASGSTTDQAIAKAQKRLRANQKDASAQLDLAKAFLQKARETADPSLYVKAGQLLDLTSKQSPSDLGLVVTKGALALAQHRFRDALTFGRLALNRAPTSQAALGVLVDAYNELGRYDEALRVTQRMVDTRPNLSSLSRVSYERELHGDPSGAVAAMTQAVTSGGSAGGENVAYVQTLLGNLLVNQGRLNEASRSYADAERSFPGFPAAQAGRARILVAEGRFGEAANLLRRVVKVQPLSEYAIAQGDALIADGQKKAAAKAYELVDVIARLYRANGVNVDLELSLFAADHQPGPDAVSLAREALKGRPSILGHDALAWNLFRNGQTSEAAKEASRALATGSRDPVLRYHAAAIALADGRQGEATAHLRIVLATNPRFSAALSDDVEALAAKLGIEVPPAPNASG